MKSTQLAIVRFTPDPVRDEPRNIGVIAWHGGQIFARFLGEEDGVLDRRTISTRLVSDRAGYGEWVEFWRSQIEAGVVQDPVKRRAVRIKSTQFLRALANVTRGGYEIRLGAEAVGDAERTLPSIVDETFQRVVEPSEESDDELRVVGARHRQLAYNATLALRKKSYREDHDFKRDYSVVGRTQRGNEVPAVFDLAITAKANLLALTDRLLLVDAVSLVASKQESMAIVDRARAVATKANEMRKLEQWPEMRALVSNGKSGESEAGRFASHILQDDGGLELVTIDQLVDLVPRVREGRL